MKKRQMLWKHAHLTEERGYAIYTGKSAMRLACVLLLLTLLLVGCGTKTVEPTLPPETPAPTAEPTPEPTPEPVFIGGQEVGPETTALLLTGEEAYRDLLEQAGRLPALEEVRLDGELATPGNIRALAERWPQLQLRYNLSLGEELVPWYTEELDLTGCGPEDLAAVRELLPLLPKLRAARLSEELSFGEYMALKDLAPQVDFDYTFTIYKRTLDTHTENVEFRRAEIGAEGLDRLREMLPYLPNLKRLQFEYCGTDDEMMDRFRSEYPDREIVWRVESLPGGGQMTDAIRLWIIGGYDDKRLAPLKYCTKVKYLDIGHNGIENLDFLYYMPDLEVLIVENDHVSDITAIGSCKNLEYLEVGETRVTDISPLANCTNLVHLNIGRLHELTDISPLYGLTKLERVYGKCDENVPPEQVEHLRELLPNCEIRFEFDPVGPIFGSWRYTQGGGYQPRYKLLHDQIGYDW